MKDAALITTQRLEHYEMAAFGTVCKYAKRPGEKDVLKLLKAMRAEEVPTDKAACELAESIRFAAQEEVVGLKMYTPGPDRRPRIHHHIQL